MTSQDTKAKTKAPPALILFGLEDGQKPRAATFDESQAEAASKLAQAMGLQWFRLAGADDEAVADELPVGRLYASGKGQVPYVRQDLYDRVTALAAATQPGPASASIADGEKAGGAAPDAAGSGEAQPGTTEPASDAPAAETLPTVFPPSWSEV